jgi:hypothetical protein
MASASALGDLPVDPLVGILSRVPAKSVCQFKCVSKAWRDLIADPDHRKKLPQTMEGLFYTTCDESSSRFSFIDVTARSVPPDIVPSFSFLAGLPGIEDLVLLDSCNGLILFEYHQYDDQDDSWGYVVCKPTTKECEVVPALSGSLLEEETHTFLAFDPAVSSHFNLVQFESDDELCLILYVLCTPTPLKLGPGASTKLTNKETKGSCKDGGHILCCKSVTEPLLSTASCICLSGTRMGTRYLS